jgi:hypothetical protein
MAGVKGRSGGARLGSGPKRRDPKAAWLTGAVRKPADLALAPRPVSGSVSGSVECPKDLPADVAAVWKQLAPFALAERTLEPRTAMAFRVLCENIVLLNKLAVAPLTAAGPDHRGMLGRVEAGWTRFRLWPDGKPALAEPVADEWSEFEGPKLVKA